MKVIIKGVANQTQGYLVNFSTEYGSATALWRGNEPQINKEYVVEVEIPGVLQWRKDIAKTEDKCSISLENGIVHIVALLESIEEDGYTVIRIDDSIISIETQGAAPTLGSNVKLITNNLLLYEVDY